MGTAQYVYNFFVNLQLIFLKVDLGGSLSEAHPCLSLPLFSPEGALCPDHAQTSPPSFMLAQGSSLSLFLLSAKDPPTTSVTF